MSRYVQLSNDGRYSAEFGWDPPLQYFFLTVYDLTADEDDDREGIVFDNLARRNPGMTIHEIVETCMDYGVVIGSSHVQDLIRDSKVPAKSKTPAMQQFLGNLKNVLDLDTQGHGDGYVGVPESKSDYEH